MIARHARVGDDQVFVDFPANGERRVIESEIALLVSLHEDEHREKSGAMLR